MKKKTLRFGKGFRIALGNRRSEAAEMVIAPVSAEAAEHTRHKPTQSGSAPAAGAAAGASPDISEPT